MRRPENRRGDAPIQQNVGLTVDVMVVYGIGFLKTLFVFHAVQSHRMAVTDYVVH